MQRVEMSDRQNQIVDTATQLLATEGARRFTVARLAVEIGVTGGAIYRHFELQRDSAPIPTEVMTDSGEMVGMVMKAGETAVTVMALLDKANTSAYGQPELTKVNIGVRDRPGILISGHDLKDLEELLEQSKDAGVDICTHGEMLPANSYPAFKKYNHLVGNYGNSWWQQQQQEFDSFNGPILLTTNCIVPVRDAYRDRIFTTGRVAYP
ncbi:MAG: TetR family transcriptional regulator [Bradymonadales bacterium]|nr:TetR family transcriptional regulator [Bradymonadales bacterium]